MEVAKYLSWITSTIRDNGGLASCNGFMITADPVLGNITASHVLTDLPSTGEMDPDELELGVLMTGGRDSTSSPLASA